MSNDNQLPEGDRYLRFLENQMSGFNLRADLNEAACGQQAPEEPETPAGTLSGIDARELKELASSAISHPANFGEDPPVIIQARDAEEARRIVGPEFQVYSAGSAWLQDDTGEDPAYLEQWNPLGGRNTDGTLNFRIK